MSLAGRQQQSIRSAAFLGTSTPSKSSEMGRTESSPKVVFLAPGNSEHGGVGTFIKQLADLLGGENVAVVTGATESTGRYRGIACRNVPGFDRLPGARALLQVMRELALRKGATLLCSGTAALLVAILVKTFLRTSMRTVVVFHGLASRYEEPTWIIRVVEKLAARLSDQRVFLTKVDSRTLGKGGHVIPNAIPVLPPDESTETLPVLQQTELVVVARHSRQKNIAILFELAERLPQVKVRIYGGGEMFDASVARAANAGLNNISLYRWAHKSDIYRSGAIFILPTFSEGFPLSILEAASRRLPLVLSDIAELREICGDDAQYFANHSAGALESVVRKLEDENEYDAWAQRAYSLVSRYSYDNWSRAWRELLA
jgi:glycosyltransferase involved in cell wall biosynthesis